MPKFLTKEQAFEKCNVEGRYIIKEDIDVEKIKTIVKIAETDIEAAGKIMLKLDKNNLMWTTIYKIHYDALRELVEAFLRFDKIKSSNHQCLFAYLCIKHPELELSWEFFEKIRTKRNGINYYGQPVSYNDFKEVELQLNIYINHIKKKIL